MKNTQEALTRYYRGETTLREERQLKEAYRQGELDQDPFLSFGDTRFELPEGLDERLAAAIGKRKKRNRSHSLIVLGSVAAGLFLILSLNIFVPAGKEEKLQLSDNTKRERFEDALRVIGNVLEEKKTPSERVLYEDESIIIAIE